MHTACLSDRIAQFHSAFCAQFKQAARRKRPDDVARVVSHAEMTDLQSIHAAHRKIGECIGRNCRQRVAHDLPNRERQRIGAVGAERAQEVALGHNARFLRARGAAWPVGRTKTDEIRSRIMISRAAASAMSNSTDTAGAFMIVLTRFW